MEGGDRGEHPSLVVLDRFLRGELDPQEAAPIIAHLLPGCEVCQEDMAPLAGVLFGRGPLPEPEAESGAEYDFPLFRAFAAARRYAAGMTQEREEARRELQTRPREIPPPAPLPEAGRNAQDRARCEALLARCRTLWRSDAEAAVMVAALAVSIAERLVPKPPAEAASVADLQARAWAELGNARRVADDFPAAEADLTRAVERAGRGSGDPLLLARLMDLTASLYNDTRRFEEAFRLLDWTHEIYRAHGDDHSAGRALISKGISAGYALDPEEAVRLLAEGLRWIDARRDPVLALAGVHNLILFLADLSRLEEARSLLEASRDLYRTCGERLDQLRARWVEGRIAAELGDDAAAEAAFLEVRTGFAEAEQPFDAALVSLDLAAVWLRQDRVFEIRNLIDETVAIFQARKIRREAIGALLMLREACEKQRATAALLRAVATELERLEPAERS